MCKWFNDWLMQMKDDHKKEEVPVEESKPDRVINFEISEPVQSIIRSLEEGWWDVYEGDSWPYDMGPPTLAFQHEWFGSTMRVDIHDFHTSWSLTDQNWMASHEKHHVEKTCKAAYDALIKRQDKRNKEVQRESFMNLVDFDVIK